MARGFGEHWFKNQETQEIRKVSAWTTCTWWWFGSGIWCLFKWHWRALLLYLAGIAISIILAMEGLTLILIVLSIVFGYVFFTPYRIIRWYYTSKGWIETNEYGEAIDINSTYIFLPKPKPKEGEFAKSAGVSPREVIASISLVALCTSINLFSVWNERDYEAYSFCNSFIGSFVDGAKGVGFSIPSETARRLRSECTSAVLLQTPVAMNKFEQECFRSLQKIGVNHRPATESCRELVDFMGDCRLLESDGYLSLSLFC